MPYEPADFRLTAVKLYYINESSNYNITITVETRTENRENGEGKKGTIIIKLTIIKSNDDTEQATKPVKKRGRGRPRKNTTNTSATENTAYITIKEQADYELSLKLRQQGIITTSGEPFEQSNRKEINTLVARRVFAFEQYDKQKHVGRIFKSRIVREVKEKQTSTPYKKLRLIIQVYND